MRLAFLSLILLPTLLVFLTLRYRSQRRSVGDEIRRNRGIANFSTFHAKSVQDLLRLRAGPNVRQTTAFGIPNSFTTTDEIEHSEFLRRAANVIKSADEAAWCRVWTRANAMMD